MSQITSYGIFANKVQQCFDGFQFWYRFLSFLPPCSIQNMDYPQKMDPIKSKLFLKLNCRKIRAWCAVL